MKTLSSLGRFVYAVPFIIFGIFHIKDATAMASVISGWPLATLLVYISGLALILAGISIIINLKAQLASGLLALLLLIIIIGAHILPPVINDKSFDYSTILKDIALMGAALTYSGILKR